MKMSDIPDSWYRLAGDGKQPDGKITSRSGNRSFRWVRVRDGKLVDASSSVSEGYNVWTQEQLFEQHAQIKDWTANGDCVKELRVQEEFWGKTLEQMLLERFEDPKTTSVPVLPIAVGLLGLLGIGQALSRRTQAKHLRQQMQARS